MAGCFCEFGCNVMYDIMLMVAIVMWMVPVTWWVFRYVHQKSIPCCHRESVCLREG